VKSKKKDIVAKILEGGDRQGKKRGPEDGETQTVKMGGCSEVVRAGGSRYTKQLARGKRNQVKKKTRSRRRK